jgi:hypothetical protein
MRKGVVKVIVRLVMVIGVASICGCAVVPLIPGAAGVFYGAAKETEAYRSGKKAETKPSTAEGDQPQETK